MEPIGPARTSDGWVHQTEVVMRRAIGLAFLSCLLAVGCASPAAVGTPPANGTPLAPTEALDTAGEFLAAEVADRLTPLIRHDPTYAGLAIHGRGLQVWAVGGGSAKLRAAVRAVTEVPVQIITARNSERTLTLLIRQVTHDAANLRKHDVDLSSWGPDVYLNKVVIHLKHYTPARAAYLVQRYGAVALMVSTESETITPL
jgi:hypothetical protein